MKILLSGIVVLLILSFEAKASYIYIYNNSFENKYKSLDQQCRLSVLNSISVKNNKIYPPARKKTDFFINWDNFIMKFKPASGIIKNMAVISAENSGIFDHTYYLEPEGLMEAKNYPKHWKKSEGVMDYKFVSSRFKEGLIDCFL